MATTSLVVVNPHYRFVAEALRVTSETADKQFSEDGLYDEVFVASYGERIPRATSISGGAMERQPFQLSAVHGDINVNMELRRVKAGTASGSGGIRGGDVVTPLLTERTISQAPASFILWDGELVPGQHDLILHPTIWEVDQSEAERARNLADINTPNCRSLLCGWAEFMTGDGGESSSTDAPTYREPSSAPKSRWLKVKRSGLEPQEAVRSDLSARTAIAQSDCRSRPTRRQDKWG